MFIEFADDTTSTQQAILSTFQFFTPDTAGWKTYENNTYGFTFKYPSNLALREYSQQSNGAALYAIALDTKTPSDNWMDAPIGIQIFQSSLGDAALAVMKGLSSVDPTSTIALYGKNGIEIDGIEAHAVADHILVENNYVYDFIQRGDPVHTGDTLDVEFHKILSTLTFAP
jgi:hypothetical protein